MPTQRRTPALEALPIRTSCADRSCAQAVAIADRALALGVDPAELAECLEQAHRWYGMPQARRVLAFADKRSESVGESFSRVRVHDLGLPAPVLQHEVYDENGYLIARGDFAWLERKTIGEFDGLSKYAALRRPGETAEDVVIREKLREDALRDQGWQMARWGWDQLRTPQVIADRMASGGVKQLYARSRPEDDSAPRTRTVRGAEVRRDAACYEMRSVSSWIRRATCLSLSSCSLPW